MLLYPGPIGRTFVTPLRNHSALAAPSSSLPVTIFAENCGVRNAAGFLWTTHWNRFRNRYAHSQRFHETNSPPWEKRGDLPRRNNFPRLHSTLNCARLCQQFARRNQPSPARAQLAKTALSACHMLTPKAAASQRPGKALQQIIFHSAAIFITALLVAC